MISAVSFLKVTHQLRCKTFRITKGETMRNHFRRVLMGLIVAAFGLMSFICLAWGGSAAPETQMTEGIEIRYFAAGKKVIPVLCEIGNWRIVDIKLPDLVVTNNGKSIINIDKVEVFGKSDDTKTVSLEISGKDLLDAVRNTANTLNKNRPPLFSLQVTYGDIVIPEGVLSDNGSASAGQSVILPLSRITYLHYIGHSKIDSLQVVIAVKNGGETKRLIFPVRLTYYENKSKYIFPLKGNLHMAFVPLSYIHHRGASSQEFAMDVVGAVQSGASDFTEISTPNPKKLTDYGVWGRDILAMGDGVVVEMGDKFPEDRMSDPAKFTDPNYTQALLKELIGKIGVTNAVAGNFVTIDHGKGEFSVYCHMKEGSVRVQRGDRVKKGMVIGQVGNTGNSGAPHLHFQLMDSADFLTANGLPVMFENVPPSVIIAEYPVKANTLGFSDNLFQAIP
jgi:hypothetical protein